MNPPASSAPRTPSTQVLAWLVITIAVVPAHFLHLRSLGVYEDDYWAMTCLERKYPREFLHHYNWNFASKQEHGLVWYR